MRSVTARLLKYAFLLIFILTGGLYISARESYEDYRGSSYSSGDSYYTNRRYERSYAYDRDKYAEYDRRERPMSEVKAGEAEMLMEELRGAVREEIDTTISRERKASRKSLDKQQILKDVRQIVRDEIEEAIRIKENVYLRRWNWEVGGYLGGQFIGWASDSGDNNNMIQLQPVFNWFCFADNVALSLKLDFNYNFTTEVWGSSGGVGPVFVFGLDEFDEICFFSATYFGMSYKSELENSVGFRVANEMGFKFVLTSGVIISAGITYAFDNAGDRRNAFQDILMPGIGVTVWL